MIRNQTRTCLSLPLFINQRNRHLIFILLFAAAALLYLTSNRYHITAPRYLTMSRIDSAIPFIPGTIWIYLSDYILFFVLYLLIKNLLTVHKLFYSIIFLQGVSVAIFLVWPTTYPRGLFPMPENLDVVTYYIFDSLRQTDTAANCCPSLHISCVFMTVLISRDERRKFFPLFLLWGTAIAISTLTTKQHYLIDIIAGLALGVFSWVIFHRCIKYRPLNRDQ